MSGYFKHFITKHLMTGPKAAASFVSLTPSMFLDARPRRTLRSGPGKHNSLFPTGPVIKCLLYLPVNSRVEKIAKKSFAQPRPQGLLIRHFENRRGEGPGDEVDRLLYAGWLINLPRFQVASTT